MAWMFLFIRSLGVILAPLTKSCLYLLGSWKQKELRLEEAVVERFSIYWSFRYKRSEYKGIPTMKSKQEEEAIELKESDQVKTDVIVDDYKDMKIDMMASSRGQRLGWNKYDIDKVTGFNDYD